MRIAEALRDATEELRACRTTDARLEAELLLRHVLGLSREELYTRLQDALSSTDLLAYKALRQRRLSHEPTPYILGRREFFGLEFEVSPAALIPRPETELLVETAIQSVKDRGPRVEDLRVVDIGTGSGAIAVTLAKNVPGLRVVATDVSREALRLAARNAAAHCVGRVDLVQGSLLEPLRGGFDLIVANLPYVPEQEYETLPPDIREHEPEVALRGGESGTVLMEELLAQATTCLRPGGVLVAEHGWNQGPRLRGIARHHFPAARVETRQDLAGIDRLMIVGT